MSHYYNNYIDIDECVVDDGGCQCDTVFGDGHSCVANCINMPGSYKCVCNEGHMLTADYRTCVGMSRRFAMTV